MRIAVISDIHSNLQALESAMEYIRSLRVDALYCLGDIVGYGANPNECVEIVRKEATFVVRGNHDQAMFDLSILESFSKLGREATDWTRQELSIENQEYLASLPLRLEVGRCTLAHASPSMPERWEYILSLDAAERQFESFTTPICFIGHTHSPMVCGEDLETFEFRKGQRFLINVGSVGQPRDHNPQLSFGFLDTNMWEYRNYRLDYDIEKASKAIRTAGLPKFFGKRIYQGV